jgi:hypothetical protein
MFKTFKHFLNLTDVFFKRLFVASIAIVCVPFILIAFVFGFFNLTINEENKNDEYE